MYNKKSKVSAILSLVAPALVFGLLVLCPILLRYTAIEGLAILALILTTVWGFLPLYFGGIAFVATSFAFGGKMIKGQSRKKLIYYNVSMLIASTVLLPFLAIGIFLNSALIAESVLGVVPIIYVVITALAYLAAWVNYIVTIVRLKKSPEEIPSQTEKQIAQEQPTAPQQPTENN